MGTDHAQPQAGERLAPPRSERHTRLVLDRCHRFRLGARDLAAIAGQGALLEAGVLHNSAATRFSRGVLASLWLGHAPGDARARADESRLVDYAFCAQQRA